MSELKTFALVPGFCHGAWHMSLLEAELNNAGHNTLTFDLPLEDPSVSFDDHASIIADDIEGHENVIGVFHSRAGNYGPRAINMLQDRNPGKLAVERMVFLCASFEPATLHAIGRPLPSEIVPPRNTPESRLAIVARPDLGDDIMQFDPALVRKFLYQDIEDSELVAQAISKLRPQNRPSSEPLMTHWPDLPQDYIIARKDQMVRPAWSRYICHNWLKVKPIYIPGGHSPFLSRPALLADLLIDVANTGA